MIKEIKSESEYQEIYSNVLNSNLLNDMEKILLAVEAADPGIWDKVMLSIEWDKLSAEYAIEIGKTAKTLRVWEQILSQNGYTIEKLKAIGFAAKNAGVWKVVLEKISKRKRLHN
ncbi:hypothetical protein HOD29_04930 [archaeon]|jgi:hypothetical protein|nr:hypothetical protein [archaeon]